MRMFVKALAAGTVAAVLLSFCRFGALCGEIRQGVVRLHVLAHDNSEEEQALKLAVRDAVLIAADGLLGGAENTATALEKAQAALPQLTAAANACLRAKGSAHMAVVTLQPTYFTTRTYDAGTLPAGWYNALRVVIGNGEGRNWWCVVFPPLCISSAVKATRLEDVLNNEARDVVEHAPRYEVRFKVVEWVSEWLER